MKRLTDREMQHYLSEGYVTLQTDFPAEFYREIWEQIDEIFEYEGNPRNENFPCVRHNAALALGRIGPDAKEAIPDLNRALKDGNRYVSGLSGIALDRIAGMTRR